MGERNIRFIVDEMLGKLSKWLRILGYDTLYAKGMKDSTIVRIAIGEKRILLTRDTSMVRKKGVKQYLLIHSDHVIDQLRQVVRELNLPYPEHSFSRCTICNVPLEPISKDEACRKVPPYVCITQEAFGICPECKRIYWKGTHYERMRERIKMIYSARNEI